MKYNELLKGINSSWSVKEKVKYLYEQVCINSIYDERIEYSKDEALIKNIYYRNIDIKKEQGNKVVCYTICQILQQLLNEINIKSRLVREVSRIQRPVKIKDVALVFQDGDNEYFCSPVGDIQNCKYGIMPVFFRSNKP